MTLPLLELPLQSGAPPTGFGWEECSESPSLTTVFDARLNQRDTFFGRVACVICGEDSIVYHCHIIPEILTWMDLKNRGWIPQSAKNNPVHEPRNGLVMCPTHHANFQNYQFYIHFSPETKKFIYINYSNHPSLEQFHGKAIALDIRAHYAPFASLFVIHEWRVRGFNPFQPIITPTIPAQILWQDWIMSSGLLDENLGFKRDGSPSDDNIFHTSTSGVHTSTGEVTLDSELSNDVVAKILAATHAQPSWKACELENAGWNGTADENMKKYLDITGTR
ncbi:hypothetical protein EDB89DRAFT_2101415 [Lactarius sanguifluus]|nr:hypothetical protein EDB89DRAFT_2101415 [Lactarius sanguifluus]